MATGKESKRLDVPSLATNEPGRHAFAMSADGRLLALARPDLTTVVVHLTGAQEPRVLGEASDFKKERDRGIAISPDGKWVAGELFGNLIVWDVTRERKIPDLKQVHGLVTAIAFAHDGKRLACAHQSGLVQAWDTETWEPIVRPEGHTNAAAGVAVTPDGKTAITAGSDRTMRIWEVHSGAELRSVNRDDWFDSVHLAPDGKSVVMSASRLGRERGKHGTKFVCTDLTGRSVPVDGALGEGFDEDWPKSQIAGFAGDGRTYMTWRRRTITMWDWPAGTKRRSIDVTLAGNWPGELVCRHARLTMDGRLLAVSIAHEEPKDFGRVGEPGGTCVVNAATGERLWSVSGPEIWSTSVAFTPDGKRLVVGGSGDSKADEFNEERVSLAMFNAATGKPLRRFQLPEGVGDRRAVAVIAVSLDGRTVAVGERDHSITVYELATGQIRQRLLGHRTELKDLVPGPNGRLFSVAWNDSFALVWAMSPAAAAQRTSLTETALATEWRKLGQPEAKVAFRAMVRMAGDPTVAATYIRNELQPVKPIAAKVLDKVFAELEADAVSVREKASQTLNEFGRVAAQAARARLKITKSEDARRRLSHFIERQEREELNAEELRAIRAVELLESIGGEESRRILEQMAIGEPTAWLTSESVQALRRLQPKRDR
jgi:WD40 repeat protein